MPAVTQVALTPNRRSMSTHLSGTTVTDKHELEGRDLLLFGHGVRMKKSRRNGGSKEEGA